MCLDQIIPSYVTMLLVITTDPDSFMQVLAQLSMKKVGHELASQVRSVSRSNVVKPWLHYYDLHTSAVVDLRGLPSARKCVKEVGTVFPAV